MEVTEIRCEARFGDFGASSSSTVSACAGVTSGFGSSASLAGSFSSSFFSSAPSTVGISGTSGTSASAVCSGAAEDDDSRRLSSDREREAEVGRGVVSVASSKASCSPGS